MNEKKYDLSSLGLFIAIGLIVSAILLGSTWRKVSRANVTVTVTGSATKEIRSDLAVWHANFSVDGLVLTEAYA